MIKDKPPAILLARLFKLNPKQRIMETLKTEAIKVRSLRGYEDYTIEEKDHGDLVVYDIFRQNRYLLTISADGGILFMNFDADEKDKELFKLSHLNEFIEKIKAHE